MRVVRVVLSAAFISISSLGAFANIYGAIRGVVHDPQHRPVQGAMVMLKAKSSDWAKTTNTDANGEFQINAVPLGDYSVAIASPGFAQTAQDVTVTSGTVPVVHFQLQVAATNAQVTVSAGTEVVSTDSATPADSATDLDSASATDSAACAPVASRLSSIRLRYQYIGRYSSSTPQPKK